MSTPRNELPVLEGMKGSLVREPPKNREDEMRLSCLCRSIPHAPPPFDKHGGLNDSGDCRLPPCGPVYGRGRGNFLRSALRVHRSLRGRQGKGDNRQTGKVGSEKGPCKTEWKRCRDRCRI